MAHFAASPGASNAVGPTSGGKVYAFNNISTVAQPVAPANPQRTSLTFCNPGAVNIYVYPQFVQAQNGIVTTNNIALAPTPSALGGCLVVYANGGSIVIQGECAGQYNAFALTGISNALTVMDSNL